MERILQYKGLMDAEMLKGDDSLPKFEHSKEVYVPEKEDFQNSDIERWRVDKIFSNKESENF